MTTLDSPPLKAVFLDRDGVLNVDHGYVYDPAKLNWIDGAREAVAAMTKAGLKVLVVTNQSGIGRGYFDEAQMGRFHAAMQDQLAELGGRIDAFYHSPFHETAVVEAFRVADHPGPQTQSRYDPARPGRVESEARRGRGHRRSPHRRGGRQSRGHAGLSVQGRQPADLCRPGAGRSGSGAEVRILQFGKTGQVATAVQAAAQDRAEIVPLSRADCDLENPEAVRAAILAADCDLVLNTAAFTHVDPAEARPDEAFAVNATAPGVMAAACAERSLPFVHLSTDAVFDGLTDRPYVETDEAKPLNIYGRSKLAGEQAVLAHPKAVVADLLGLFPLWPKLCELHAAAGPQREVLKVVADQFGTPTDGEALADFLTATAPRWAAASADDPAFGLFHFANAGETNRFDFAKAAIDRDPLSKARVEPTTRAAFAEPAPRPPRSPLDTGKLQAVFGVTLEPWRTAVERTADRLVAAGLPG
jgi:dTDP-4-dehydrorhamnose reductase